MVIRAQDSLNLSCPSILFFTSTNIYQTQGLWLWCPILGPVAVIPGPRFSPAILGKVGSASWAGGTSAGMKAESLGSQIRLVLDLHGRAETSPRSPHKSGQQKQKRESTKTQEDKNIKLSKPGQRREELGDWGKRGHPSECQLARVHFSPETWPGFPLPPTEMAQDEALAE